MKNRFGRGFVTTLVAMYFGFSGMLASASEFSDFGSQEPEFYGEASEDPACMSLRMQLSQLIAQEQMETNNLGNLEAQACALQLDLMQINSEIRNADPNDTMKWNMLLARENMILWNIENNKRNQANSREILLRVRGQMASIIDSMQALGCAL